MQKKQETHMQEFADGLNAVGAVIQAGAPVIVALGAGSVTFMFLWVTKEVLKSFSR